MKIRLFLLFPFLLLLSGCLHPSELKDTAIVGAVAVDYRQEEFFLTMQIFDPTAGGSQNNVNLDALTNKTLAVHGPTLGEAISECERLEGKKIFYQQCELLILGKNAAKQVLEHTVDFFYQIGKSNLHTTVAMCEGWAGELLSIENGDSIIASNRIASLLQHAVEEGKAVSSSLLQVASDLSDDPKTTALPVLAKQEDGSVPIATEQTAVIKDGQWLTTLNKNETIALCWLIGEMDSTIFNLSAEDGTMYAIEARRESFSIHPKCYQNRLYLDFQCQISGALFEAVGDRQTEKENIDTAQEALEEKLSTDLEYLLYKLVIQNGTDLFSIHDLVRRQFSDFYKQNKDNFSDILQDSKIYLQLQADVYQATGR